MTNLEQRTRLQLYCKEAKQRKLLDVAKLEPEWAMESDFQTWCEGKRELTINDVSGRVWVKSCPAGYITEVHFHLDGTLNEYRLFDRFETSGRWNLNSGLLEVAIEKGENQYRFAVVANRSQNIHSAIEYKNDELHSYLKLVQVETTTR